MAEFVESRFLWTKGDWGNQGAFMAGRGEDGWFKGTNVLVRKDGSLCPRPGLKARTYTGLPANPVRWWSYAAVTVGAVSGVIIFVVENKAYWVPAFTDGAATEIGTLAGIETAYSSAAPVLSGGKVYFALRSQGVYEWNPAAVSPTPQLTRVFAQGGILDFELYGERCYASSIRTVWYSDAADFTQWDAALQFFKVGWEFANYRMASLRNNLYFFRQGGGHFVMSGAPGSTSTLRETGAGLPPDIHSTVKVRTEDAAVWIPQVRNAPVYYRGGLVDSERWKHLEDWTTSGNGEHSGAFSFGEQGICFTGTADDTGLLRHRDVWTKHEWDVNARFVSRVSADAFAFCDLGNTGVAPKFWVWYYAADLPGVVGTDWPPGDASDTPVSASVSLPEWWHAQGQEVRVVSVEVEFDSFDTGTSQTAHFDLTVDALGAGSVGNASRGTATSATQTLDEPVSSSSATGDARRITFNVGDQGWGRGYQIHLTNIRSVAIRSITAQVRVEPRDPKG